MITYISDGYSKLTASVKTKDWKTPMFKIKCGMFQGDTLSPVIFLTVFNPLIELSSRHTTSGFSLKVPVPNSVGLPRINSATYVYWDENSFDTCNSAPPAQVRAPPAQNRASPYLLFATRWAWLNWFPVMRVNWIIHMWNPSIHAIK